MRPNLPPFHHLLIVIFILTPFKILFFFSFYTLLNHWDYQKKPLFTFKTEFSPMVSCAYYPKGLYIQGDPKVTDSWKKFINLLFDYFSFSSDIIMNKYSTEERTLIVQWYFESHGSNSETWLVPISSCGAILKKGCIGINLGQWTT